MVVFTLEKKVLLEILAKEKEEWMNNIDYAIRRGNYELANRIVNGLCNLDSLVDYVNDNAERNNK